MYVVEGKNISEKTLVPQCEISSILKKTEIIARDQPLVLLVLGAHEALKPIQAKAVSITVLTEGSERRVSSRCRRQQNQEVEFKEVKFREQGTSGLPAALLVSLLLHGSVFQSDQFVFSPTKSFLNS